MGTNFFVDADATCNDFQEEQGYVALGCLVLVIVFVLAAACFAMSDGGSDCYATPGAQPGSAQAERDTRHCIEGR